MTPVYAVPGLQFRPAESWQLSEEQSERELSLTLRPEGDSTAFWSLTLLFDRPDPQETLQSVLEAFEEEYEEIDIYPVEQRVARREASARDIEFVCLELTNSAYVRVFQTPRFTAVLLYQATDHEVDAFQPDFDAMTASIECDLDEVRFS